MLKRSCNTSTWSIAVMSDSLQPHGLQHTRLPCPSPIPGACSNSCPSSQWCHPAISSCVTAFSSCPQSFPASGSFPVSQFFASGGQSIGVSTCLVSLFYKFCLLPHPPPPLCKLGIARKGVCLFHLRYWYCDFLLFYFWGLFRLSFSHSFFLL